MYLVAGTQADRASNNKLVVMKLTQLHRTKHDEDEDDAELSDSDDDDEEDPVMEVQVIPHQGGVNRVRVRVLLVILTALAF
jgi:ribosome assembly protein RRB1